jgi:hypothetical protein
MYHRHIHLDLTYPVDLNSGWKVIRGGGVHCIYVAATEKLLTLSFLKLCRKRKILNLRFSQRWLWRIILSGRSPPKFMMNVLYPSWEICSFKKACTVLKKERLYWLCFILYNQTSAHNWSRNSIVGIATGYGLDDRGVRVRAPVGQRTFSSPSHP